MVLCALLAALATQHAHARNAAAISYTGSLANAPATEPLDTPSSPPDGVAPSPTPVLDSVPAPDHAPDPVLDSALDSAADPALDPVLDSAPPPSVTDNHCTHETCASESYPSLQ